MLETHGVVFGRQPQLVPKKTCHSILNPETVFFFSRAARMSRDARPPSHIGRHGVLIQDAPGVAFAGKAELVPEKAACLEGSHCQPHWAPWSLLFFWSQKLSQNCATESCHFRAPLHRDAGDSWSCVRLLFLLVKPELVPEKAATLGALFIVMLESAWRLMSCVRKAATAMSWLSESRCSWICFCKAARTGARERRPSLL